MRARVLILPRTDILDPQGRAVSQALGQLGFASVQEVRVGRVVEVELATTDAAEAERQVAQMADALLANPIVEDWTVQWL